jgi:hypothetical protein
MVQSAGHLNEDIYMMYTIQFYAILRYFMSFIAT